MSYWTLAPLLRPPLIQQVLLPCRHYLCSLLYRVVFLRSTVSLAARCLPFQAHGRVRNAVEVAFQPEVRALDLLGTACWACGCGRAVRADIKLLTTERIGCNITFDKVAREWRCKYAADASGGPADSASLKAAEELLQSYLPTLKALPNAEVTRVMCGGCHDFKIVVNQPCADHDAWKASDYAPEQEFISKLSAIEGISAVETQESTCQPL